ncbi:MAG TPA: hypothetical protein VG225_14245 [Terracidiphilus sp.]|jgi:type IV secretory pathway VirB2 component (pilin)|nr:hypothetical protein [Terracidiphilus sp.]
MLSLQGNQAPLSEASTIYVCWLVGGIGLLVLVSIVAFGVLLNSGRLRFWRTRDGVIWEDLIHRWTNSTGQPEIRPIIEAYTEHLQRRNEFWTSYGQTIVAVLIIIVLTILLLTRTISAEAGLPVLSGISGFAIAKSVSASRSASPQDMNRRG